MDSTQLYVISYFPTANCLLSTDYSLAAVNFSSPLFWAMVIGWIISVTFHEVAHGIVAHLGGDYTISERGGLIPNPLEFIDPMSSLLLPLLCLLMGGIPLPGGATYIRRDLLRSRGWESAVSLAGPVSNLILFALLALSLHPKFQWYSPLKESTSLQQLVAALATLQFFAAIFNLIPVPPLDGFGILAPYMDRNFRDAVTTPPTSTYLFLGFFILVSRWPGFADAIFSLMSRILGLMGFSPLHIWFFGSSYNNILWGA